MFLIRLENIVDVGALALASHMDLYVCKAFTKFNKDFILNKVLVLLVDPWVQDMDPTPLLVYPCWIVDFPIRLGDVAATYLSWLL